MTEDCKECGWNNNGNCLAYPDMCAEIDDCEHKQLKRLEQENNAYKQSEQEATEIIAELKEYSQRMENQRENYYKEYKKLRSALEEIIQMFLHQVAWVGQLTNFEEEIYNKINEVLK